MKLKTECCMSGPVVGIFIKRMHKPFRANVLNVIIYISATPTDKKLKKLSTIFIKFMDLLG